MRSAVLLGVAVAWGCEPRADPEPGYDVLVGDSVGIEVVETGPGWRNRTPRWSLDSLPAVVIAPESPRGEYLLERVGDVQRLDDGRWAVENRGSREIYFFDPAGRFLDRSGGEGHGPDEFHRSTEGLDVCDEGHILVWVRGTAVTLRPDGLVSDRRDLPNDAWLGQGTYSVPAGANEDCSRILVNRWYGGWAPQDEPGPVVVKTQLLWVDLDAERVDTIAVRTGSQGLRMPDGHVADVLAFALRSSWAVRGDMAYWGLGDRPEYTVLNPAGDVVRIVRWHAAPEPVTDSDWRAWDRERAGLLDVLPSAIIAAASDQSQWTVKPFYGGIRMNADVDPAFRLDGQGNLWIREFKREPLSRWADFMLGTERPAQDWIVFDPAGRLIATVRTPETFWVRGIHGGYVFGVALDPFAVEEVRAYRIRRETGGP